MPPVRLMRCFLPMVILVSGYAFGNRVKTVDPSSGRRSGGFQPATGDLTAGAVDGSSVEYVDNLEPLYDFLIQHRLHKLCKLLREAQLQDVLDTGPFTIFAPTDGSFVFLPGGTLEEIQRNPQRLRDFVLHHIVPGDINSHQILDELVVTSLQGSPLRFNIYGSRQVYTVSGAQILTFDLPFELGRVHIIDHPLYPVAEVDTIGYLQATNSEFYRLLLSTGLVDFLSGGTYTFLAPDDKAFSYLSQELLDALYRNQSLAERILLNHVLPASIYTRGIVDGMQLGSVGGTQLTFTESRGLIFVNGVPIVLPDVPVTNGVIHVVNRVLLPEDIDTDCQCKSSTSRTTANLPRTPSRTTGGQDPSGGGQFGSRQPQGQLPRPGSPSAGSRRPGTPHGEASRLGSPHGTGQTRRPGSTPERENIVTGGIPVSDGRPQQPFVAGHVPDQETPGDDFVPGQPQTPGSALGTGPGHRPGSSFGTGHTGTPGGTFGTRPGSSFEPNRLQTPGSTPEIGSPERPGSSFGPEQPHTPGNGFGTGVVQRPGSSFPRGQPQTPGSTFGPGSVQRPQSSFGPGPQVPGSTFGTRPAGGQGRPVGPWQSQTPGSTSRTGSVQTPGSRFETGQQQTPGTTFDTSQRQRPGSSFGTSPGSPQRPGSSPASSYPQRPESGTREPHRPVSEGVSGRLGRPQRPGTTFETEYPGQQPQTPEGTFETGQPQRPGSISRPGATPISPDETPGVPGRIKTVTPGRIPLPPPPTRAPTSSRTRTTRYPSGHLRGTPTTIPPQDDGTQFGGSPGDNDRSPYRPTRGPPTAGVPRGTRYPVPSTPTRGPQVTTAYPDIPRDIVTHAPDDVGQPGAADSRKQPSTPRPQYERHRTPRPTGGISPRPPPLQPGQRQPIGQPPLITTRAPVSRPGYRPIPQTTNCRQPGDRITSSNRNFPLCSVPDANEEPCQGAERPYDPSDPRPACPGTTFDQGGCRPPLQPPAANDRRPVCRISQRRPECREYNEPRDNRPLCPGSPRNCRLPEEPEDPFNPLPICQELVSVEGCRRPNYPYDPQDRRPECPPDDCRPPQEPLRPGDARPLCSVNEEDSIRQPLVPTTTTRPWLSQQPRPGSRLPQTPGVSQGRPGTQPSQTGTSSGSRPQTPSWQRPHSSRQPTRPEPLTTRKPGKQPQGRPAAPGTTFIQPDSPEDNDALSAPLENPPSRPGYPGSSQSDRRQGQPPRAGLDDSTGPGSIGHGTTSAQPQDPGQSRPGRPHSTVQRPTGQGESPHSTVQRPPSQGRPQTGQRQPGVQHPQSQPPRVSQPPAAPGSPSAGGDSSRSLLDIVQDPGLQIKGHPVKLTIVLDLFDKAGLVHILEGPGPATVFLPSDDAFKKLPRGVIEQLQENPDFLQQVLLYHVVSNEVRPSLQETSITVPTLQGMSLVITMLNRGRLILIGGAKAVAVTRASNGIFYVINELLYPLPHEDIVSALKSRPDLTQVTSLVEQSGLTNMLTGPNPFTLFAPTDMAFAQLPQGALQDITRNSTAIRELLLGHITEGAHFGREFLAGGVFPNARGGKLRFKVLSYGYTVNDVNIKTPEIVTGTGVIHLVDQVLLEPEDLPATEDQPQSAPGPAGDTNVVRIDTAGNYEDYPEIAELARGMGLNRFLSWITNTGLIEKVHDGGSYTILAPTDEAINSLPPSMAQAIESDPDQVRPLLKFHIIAQHIDVNNIRNEQTAPTLLQDKRIRFNVYQDDQDQLITACGVPITQTQGSAGPVRLIAVNQALYPPSGNLAQVLEASPILQNLGKAIRKYHLSWMLNGQGPTTIFAPSDAAFEALSEEDRKNLIENRQAFTDLLKRHIVKGSVFTSGVRDGMQLRNEKRETVTFSVHPGGISVNSIPISYSDITATNGVLHVIDHFM